MAFRVSFFFVPTVVDMLHLKYESILENLKKEAGMQ